MSRVLVTGAEGFIGKALCQTLRGLGHDVTGTTRRQGSEGNRFIGDIAVFDDWQSILQNIEVIVHLAARAHVVQDSAPDPLNEFRRFNVQPTDRLATAAVVTGVSRLVFVSSIGVNGVESGDAPFREMDQPDPTGPYAVSKYEAEQLLRAVEKNSDLEVTIIRPPLVYGPRARGNFFRLLQLVDGWLPIPLGAVRNRRSFIGLQNLCDLLAICVSSPVVKGETFLAADGEDVSTPELLRTMAETLGQSLWMPPVPMGLMQVLANMAGRGADFERLTRSLQVDAGRVQSVTGWRPKATLRDGIAEMAIWYRNVQSS